MSDFILESKNSTTTVVGAILSVESIGIPSDGITDIYTSLNNKIAEVAGGNAELYFPAGNYYLGTNLTIPSGLKLIMASGAYFTVALNVTLTLNCEIDAGLYQIFSGSGTVNGTIKNDVVYPQWWGAVGDAGYYYAIDGEYYTNSSRTTPATDDTIAFQKAMDFCQNTYKTVFFPKLANSYLIKYLGLKQGVNLKSNYGTLCAKKLTSQELIDYPGFLYLAELGAINFITYENFLVEGNDFNTNQNCFHFKALHQTIPDYTGGIWYSKISTIRINDFPGKAIYLYCNDRDITGFSQGISCTANASTDTITKALHNLLNGTSVQFTATSLPGGLTLGVNYYVVQKTDNTFQLSTTYPTENIVNITSTGTSVKYYVNADMANQFLDFEKVIIFRNLDYSHALYVEGQLGQVKFNSCEFDGRPVETKVLGESVYFKPIVGGSTTDSSIQYVVFDNCTFQQAEKAIYAYNVTNLVIRNCWFESLTLGVDLTSSTNATITDTYFGNVGSPLDVVCVIDGATNTITKVAHGLNDGDMVKFGATGLPTGLTAGTYYYVRDKTADTFKVAAGSGGTEIDITSSPASSTYSPVGYCISVGASCRLTHGNNHPTGTYDFYVIGNGTSKGIVSIGGNTASNDAISKYKDMSTNITMTSIAATPVTILDIENKKNALITTTLAQDFNTIYSKLADGETFTGIVWGANTCIIRATGNIYLGNGVSTITLSDKDVFTVMRLQISGLTAAKWIVISHSGVEA